MCGIFGFVDISKPLPRDAASLLKKMAASLHHRGPDSQGFTVTPHAALGATRLAITDPSHGIQPFFSRDRKISAVHNGEIYNAGELRKKLSKKGHRFISTSDSEIIPHLYEEEGENFVTLINGMFAIALWDDKKKHLLLARDRFGEKPLFYARTASSLIFASEMKAILIHSGIDRGLDSAAMDQYFAHLCTLTEETIYRGIRKLPPAHLLIMKPRLVSRKRYWSLPPQPDEDHRPASVIAEELRSRIQEAVWLQRPADVPIGAFLSGGIDTAIVNQVISEQEKKLPTFSLSFHNAPYDESSEANRLSRFFKTSHHSVPMPDITPAVIEKISHHFDEPFADTSAIPTYFVSELARSKVKVVLGGDGGDELFGGYPHYKNTTPQIRRPVNLFNENERIFLYSDNALSLFKKNKFSSLENDLMLSGTLPKDPLRKLLWMDLFCFLPNDMLTKIDRMAMAWGLETRSPFLDHRLVEFVWRLPSIWKVKEHDLKHGLKAAYRKQLPAWCLKKRKKGFVLEPGQLAKKGPLKNFVDDLLSAETIKKMGLLSPTFVQQIRLSYATALKNRDVSLRVKELRMWSLIFFLIWQKREYRF